MLRNQKARLGVWALVAGVLLLLSAPARAQTITAKPQAVKMPAAQNQRSSLITWDAGPNPKAQVRLKIDDGDETGFSDKAKGSQAATIELNKTYTFTLYKDGNAKDVLATVVVTGKGASGGAVKATDAPANDDAPAVAAAVSFSGTWKTIAGEIECTVILKQIGKNVTGSYSPGNGKIFEGVVTGNKLTFKWTQDGGKEGTAEFTMDEDGKGFTGRSSALKPTEYTFSWSTHKAPATSVSADKSAEKITGPPISFDGVWKTMLGTGKEIQVSLQQTGDKVTGKYMPGDGEIKQGVVTGRVLRFQWTRWEDGLAGSGRFEMGSDGKSISGVWIPSRDPNAAGTPWYGTLKKLFSFTGVWNTMLAIGKEIEISLRQTGDKVTGTYMPGNAQITDGVVTGRELRFQWTQEDGLSGSGRLELVGFDGTSISGVWIPSQGPNAAGTGWYGTLEPLSFAGCWKLTGGMMPGETICLKQDKSGHVTDGAQFEGTVVDNTLRFTEAAGSGRFVLDKGGKSFRGFWHPGNDPELEENPCTGIFVHKPFPATFAGAWQAKLGDTGLQLVFQQTGDRVTGQVLGFSYGVVIRDGKVVGNTLSFTLERPDPMVLPGRVPRYLAFGSGELVMDRGSKSFTGTLLGAATSGTLVGR